MPVVDATAAEKAIAAGALASVYVLFGDDTRRIEEIVGAIEATIDPADRPFAVERLYAGDAGGSPMDIAAAARVYPMLGDRRIVIVLRAERLLKPKRAGNRTDDDDADEGRDDEGEALDAAPLEAFLREKPSPITTLVFVATEIDRSRRLTKQAVAAGTVVECRGIVVKDDRGRPVFDRRLAERLAQSALSKAGKAIDSDGLALLVDGAGTDVGKLHGDIDKLVLFTEGRPRIAYADVAEVVSSGGGVSDDWAVVNAISDRNAGAALKEAARRLDRGDSVHAMVGQIRWWVSSKLVLSRPERVRPALEVLLRTDLALKSSGGDERVLVERLIAELAR